MFKSGFEKIGKELSEKEYLKQREKRNDWGTAEMLQDMHYGYDHVSGKKLSPEENQKQKKSYTAYATKKNAESHKRYLDFHKGKK